MIFEAFNSASPSLAKEYGGLKLDQAKRLKKLERENGKLKLLVAEMPLEKQVL
jgi:putative transposase